MSSRSYYSLHEVAEIMGISYDSARRRISRGMYPAITYNGRAVGVLKRVFWEICWRQENDRQIDVNRMPQAYKAERVKYIGGELSELKRCPFCGGYAELRECRDGYVGTGWRVRCIRGCAATFPVMVNAPQIGGDGKIDESTRYDSKQAAAVAISKWNRRVSPNDL